MRIFQQCLFKSIRHSSTIVPCIAVIGFGHVFCSEPAIAQALEAGKAEIITAQAEGAASQERIDRLDDQTNTLEVEYKAVLQQLDTLRVYNQQLRDLIANQETEMVQVNRDIDRVTTIDREVIPLMLRMVDALDQFVELDVPFLSGERRERVSRLRQTMLRADASPAEKFRRVLESYQIENEYGRTIEGYQGQVVNNAGQQLTVDFLRIGRVAFIYKTLDDSEMSRWNQKTRAWESLDSDYLSDVKRALSIARQQVAPDLVLLPIDAAEGGAQ